MGLSSLVRRWGPLRLYQATLVVQPVAYVVWMVAGGSYVLLALFAALLGVSYGGYVALGPTVAAHLFGVVGLGSLLGTLFFGSAIGGLVGPPLAGFLADRTEGHLLPIAMSFVATVVRSSRNLAGVLAANTGTEIITMSVTLPSPTSMWSARPRALSCCVLGASGLPPPIEKRPMTGQGPLPERCGAFE